MKTILVVEDSLTHQRLIESVLGKSGLNVVIAENAETAMSWLEKNTKPDLILLDIVMPGANGLEFCREVRSQSALETTPIIFCSSKDQDFDRFWALRQGGNAYITKPFEPDELLQTIENYLN